jgi:hypothetical protein
MGSDDTWVRCSLVNRFREIGCELGAGTGAVEQPIALGKGTDWFSPVYTYSTRYRYLRRRLIRAFLAIGPPVQHPAPDGKDQHRASCYVDYPVQVRYVMSVPTYPQGYGYPYPVPGRVRYPRTTTRYYTRYRYGTWYFKWTSDR